MGINLAYPPTGSSPRLHNGQGQGFPGVELGGCDISPSPVVSSTAVLYLSELARGSPRIEKEYFQLAEAGQTAGRCAQAPTPHLPAWLCQPHSASPKPRVTAVLLVGSGEGRGKGRAASRQSIQLCPGGPRQWQTEGTSLVGSHTWPSPSLSNHPTKCLQVAVIVPGSPESSGSGGAEYRLLA